MLFRCENLITAGHLWNPLRVDEAAGFYVGQACRYQSLDQADTCFDAYRGGFVLQAVAGTDVDELNAGRNIHGVLWMFNSRDGARPRR